MRFPHPLRIQRRAVSRLRQSRKRIGFAPIGAGTIPTAPVLPPLVELGAWPDVNGETIHGTHPWTRAESITQTGSRALHPELDDALRDASRGRSHAVLHGMKFQLVISLEFQQVSTPQA